MRRCAYDPLVTHLLAASSASSFMACVVALQR